MEIPLPLFVPAGTEVFVFKPVFFRDWTFFTFTSFFKGDTHETLTYHAEEFFALYNCAFVITRTGWTDAFCLFFLNDLVAFFCWEFLKIPDKGCESVHRDPSLECYGFIRINLFIFI